ncbi:hypothetical protein J467_4285, partial [Acinetobacter baumannii 916567]
ILFSCLKGRGFNLENTRLTDPRRVKKLKLTKQITNLIFHVLARMEP